MGTGGDDDSALQAAERVLCAGGTVVLPTDTVYGLAVLPDLPGAVARACDLKGRPADLPVAVLVADIDAALALVEPPPRWALDLMAGHWPGPLTLVLTRRSAEEPGGTVGLRCPDDRFVRDLARRVGPLATTSANRHGEPTPETGRDAAASLDGEVDLLVDGGPCAGVASSVVDCTVDPPEVLREGSLSLDQLSLARRTRVRMPRPGGR